jgi:hypothetical protein
MDLNSTITFTLRDKINNVDLARWIRKVYSGLTSQQCLIILRRLRRGGTWEIACGSCYDYENGPCDFVVNCAEIDYWDDVVKKWDFHSDLLKRGADGDAQAAIEYCKLELAGEISHGAIG